MSATTTPAAAAAPSLRLPVHDQPATLEALRDLRRCHLGAAAGAPVPADWLPALLAPFRRVERVRSDYPLFVPQQGDPCQPLSDLLAGIAAKAGAEGRVLLDNVVRLERAVRKLLTAGAAAEPGKLLTTACDDMLQELQLRQPIADGVRGDVQAAAAALPKGELLALDRSTPLRLLGNAARRRRTAAHRAFAERAAAMVRGLHDLLAVEAGKAEHARNATAVQRSLGAGADRFLDPTALARSMGPHRGTQVLDADRRRRVVDALAALERHLATPVGADLVLCHDGNLPVTEGLAAEIHSDPCAAAASRFDLAARDLLTTIRAARLAELELQAAYAPDRHDQLLQAMDWQACTADELALLPVFVAVVTTAALRGPALPSLARQLVSGRPLQVLALSSAADDPVLAGDQALQSHRLELGYLGIAFREVFVQQSTAARPGHLLAGFQAALQAARPGIHLVESGLDQKGGESPLGAFLHAGAAIEGRAHPLFHYDPAAGETWATRLDFAHNPAPEADWPTSELPCGNAQGAIERLELAFTFADFALLEPGLRAQFAVVPDRLQSDELVPLARHLELAAGDAERSLPFVWAAGADGVLHRVLVRRSLLQACRDRRRYWHTLQELAGVRNDYVREAVHRARTEAAADAARELQALAQRHEAEVAGIKAQAAGEAMQGLARMLLELDPLPAAGTARTVVIPTAPKAEAAPAAAPVPAAAPAKPAAKPAKADDDLDEPWIDTPRCSTCNDCVNLNSLMFAYDGNKQARIKDPRAGTYAQMVQAAEKCPSRCIHPGKPLNPNEPGLEDLIRRAAPFR